MKNWENVIERAVRESYQSPIPLNKGFTALAQVREHLIWMDITKPKASIEVNHIILVNSFDKTFLHLCSPIHESECTPYCPNSLSIFYYQIHNNKTLNYYSLVTGEYLT